MDDNYSSITQTIPEQTETAHKGRFGKKK